MDRRTTYFGALVQETDSLQPQQNAMAGLGGLAQATLGTAAAVDGFTCIPTAPASLTAILTPGAIYVQDSLEATAWSSLPANTTIPLVKQGLMPLNDPIVFVPPVTAGFAQVFLIETRYADLDTNPRLLPYYNVSNPAVPFQGPNNSGASQNTDRLGIASIQVKAGVAATSGTQIAPTPDAGWTGLFYVTLVNGQTTITSGNITPYLPASFIPVKLPTIPAAIQNSKWIGFDDVSVTPNLIVINPQPPVAAYAKYQRFFVKIANTVTGQTQINVSGLGFVACARSDLTSLGNGDLIANSIVELVYDGTYFEVVGNVLSSQVQNLIQRLAAPTYQIFSANGTFTPPPRFLYADFALIGGGASGGVSTGGSNFGGGGGTGGVIEGQLSPTQVGASLAVVIGAGGAAVTSAVLANGNNGAASTVAGMTAGGGQAGIGATGLPGTGGVGGVNNLGSIATAFGLPGLVGTNGLGVNSTPTKWMNYGAGGSGGSATGPNASGAGVNGALILKIYTY
jgi:hypothetical protein